MSNSGKGSKFSVNIGSVSGGDVQVGDRTYTTSSTSTPADPTPSPVRRTILFLASSPVDKARLRLDQEAREISEGLRRSNERDQFEFKQAWAVTPQLLYRALIDQKPQIVHFCGHAEGESGLVLEDGSGKAKFVSTEAIANLFEIFADKVECVVLNACLSETQAKAIAQHIPYVIGMSDAVGDRTSINFAVGFYDGLGGGKDYETAFKIGRVAIALEGIPQEHIPQIYKKS